MGLSDQDESFFASGFVNSAIVQIEQQQQKVSHHLVHPCRFNSTPTTIPPCCSPALHSQLSPCHHPACSFGMLSQWSMHACHVQVATYVKSAQSKQQLETYALINLRISPTVCETFIWHSILVLSASHICTIVVGRV